MSAELQPTFSFMTDEHRLMAEAAQSLFEDLASEDMKRRQQQKSRLDQAAIEAALGSLGLSGEGQTDPEISSGLIQAIVMREAGAACLSFPVLETLLIRAVSCRTEAMPVASSVMSTAGLAGEIPLFDRDRVTGTVLRVAFAEPHRHMLVAARQHEGIAFVQVALDVPQVSLKPVVSVEADYPLCDVRMQQAPVKVLANVDAAGSQLVELRASLLAAAEINGACRRMVAMTRDHLMNRSQFGAVLGANQVLKHAIAGAHIKVESLAAAVDYAAASLDASAPDCIVAIAAAKSFAGRIGKSVGESMLQLHGAIGYTMEYHLHLLIRRVLRLAASHLTGEALEKVLFEKFIRNA